ncbi:MAG TPA: ABC transporter permease [Candidatus Dormibacteraeota bacterium]|nr:ABC transporter permease [Candidatus Dormibacteraeota bacterium]
MTWADALTLAARAALRRRVRTGLTALGVTLGTGLLVALAVITSAADTKVLERIGQGGPITLVKVAAAQPRLNQLDSDSFQTAGPHDLTDADLAAIRRAPHVARVVPVLAGPVVEAPESGGTFTDEMVGIDVAQASSLPVSVLAGRLPAAGSLTEVAATTDYLNKVRVDARHPRAVLGTRVVLSTPRVDAGDQVHSRSFTGVIVGVVTQEVSEDGDFVVPLAQARLARQWAMGGVGGRDFPLPTSPYSGAMAVASGLDEVHDVRAEIGVLGFATSAPEHLVASVEQYLGVVNVVLGSIGSVALGVALLSIANALLAAVHERRRDIGVLKAIGGRDRDVLRWFLVEALGIGLAGGFAGAVAGVLIAELVGVAVNRYLVANGLGSLDLVGVPVLIPVAGWLGTGLLALVAGGVPALAAARLPAREAVVEA